MRHISKVPTITSILDLDVGKLTEQERIDIMRQVFAPLDGINRMMMER
jgi:hypothetical protein